MILDFSQSLVFFMGDVMLHKQGLLYAEYVVTSNNAIIKVNNGRHLRLVDDNRFLPLIFEIMAPIKFVKIITGSIPQECMQTYSYNYYLALQKQYYHWFMLLEWEVIMFKIFRENLRNYSIQADFEEKLLGVWMNDGKFSKKEFITFDKHNKARVYYTKKEYNDYIIDSSEDVMYRCIAFERFYESAFKGERALQIEFYNGFYRGSYIGESPLAFHLDPLIEDIHYDKYKKRIKGISGFFANDFLTRELYIHVLDYVPNDFENYVNTLNL